MRWYLNQAVILYEFGTVERAFSPACQTNCFQGEAYMHWDPCGSLTAMTDASGSLVASFAYDKAYSRKINEHNPYGIEIPFQFDGRDATMTAT
jgi:hypothetical protein